MSQNTSSTEAIARSLIQAVETGDLETLGALYAEDVVIWQNTSGKCVDKSMALKMIAWMGRTLDGMKYEDVRHQDTASGYLQQHRLTGTRADGTVVALDACLIATLKDGKYVRIDEYLDSAQTARLTS